jgi:hypothetical protein
MTKTPTLRVDWLPDSLYSEGGTYVLVTGNGHLFAEAARKGRHEPTRKRLEKLAELWNADAARAAE